MKAVRTLVLGLVLVSSSLGVVAEEGAEGGREQPWDYSPYRVLIWISSDRSQTVAAAVDEPLRALLDRDFAAVWRTDIADSPAPIRTLASRELSAADYDAITASDPVLAVRRDHPDAVRIQVAANVGQYCQTVYATPRRIDEVTERAARAGDATLAGVGPRLKAVPGDEIDVTKLWSDPSTEALLISRGLAQTLAEPEAKIIAPPISGLISETVQDYDKVFIVHIRASPTPGQVEVVEMDTLMRHFGPVVRTDFSSPGGLLPTITHAITAAFAPVVRIENAGQRNATGLLRGGGLVLDEDSPAAVRLGDVLEPMVRKDDRSGQPFAIGPIEWALLLVTGKSDRYLEMDYYAGRAGSLQGRKNARTFRMALKARPRHESTLLRLHLQGKPDFPLIGYELYERPLDAEHPEFIFVGRTDWNGRLKITKADHPLRLLYVKNGGAVLARLPLSPGLYEHAIADLSGDDLRLEAEAYVRGVQNNITDLVAIRELYKARIRLRLKNGELDKAETLMSELRRQPDNKALSDAVSAKQTEFLNAIGRRNIGQRRKVDEMFTVTRELLAKFITPKLIRDLEADLIAARENGGRLPADDDEAEDDGVDDAEPAAEVVDEPVEPDPAETADPAAGTQET